MQLSGDNDEATFALVMSPRYLLAMLFLSIRGTGRICLGRASSRMCKPERSMVKMGKEESADALLANEVWFPKRIVVDFRP
jgi:hypothetical protein